MVGLIRPHFILILISTSQDDRRWLDWLDNKIALLINKDGVDVRDYGGKDYAEYVQFWIFFPKQMQTSSST